MIDKTKKIIEDNLKKLPKEIGGAINSCNWEKISEEIGKNFNLSENEITDLQIEVACVLLGITEEELLPLNIENNVGLSKEESAKISNEVEKKIITPVFNKAETLIKEKIKYQNPTWDQNINFITSGGNYFSFIKIEQ